MGNPKIFLENEKNFHFGCNGCDQDPAETMYRWICLTCRPEKYQANGYVDFCNECIDIIRNRDTNNQIEALNKKLRSEGHDNDSHIYLRINFANQYKH